MLVGELVGYREKGKEERRMAVKRAEKGTGNMAGSRAGKRAGSRAGSRAGRRAGQAGGMEKGRWGEQGYGKKGERNEIRTDNLIHLRSGIAKNKEIHHLCKLDLNVRIFWKRFCQGF